MTPLDSLTSEGLKELELFFSQSLDDVRKEINTRQQPTSPRVRFIEKLTIPACTGERTIARTKSVFSKYIHPRFNDLDCVSGDTPITNVLVYELIKNSKFADIFNSFSVEKEHLFFTQDQVITFVEKHPNSLRTDGYGNFFLLREKGEFFIADVYFRDGRLWVDLYVFGYGHAWNADRGHRVLVPQL